MQQQSKSWAKRARIVAMAELGMLSDEIAVSLGIHLSVLMAVFGDVIEKAIIRAKFEALQKFAALANSGKHHGITIAWAKFLCAANKKDANGFLGGSMPLMQVLNHLGETIG